MNNKSIALILASLIFFSAQAETEEGFMFDALHKSDPVKVQKIVAHLKNATLAQQIAKLENYALTAGNIASDKSRSLKITASRLDSVKFFGGGMLTIASTLGTIAALKMMAERKEHSGKIFLGCVGAFFVSLRAAISGFRCSGQQAEVNSANSIAQYLAIELVDREQEARRTE